MILTPELTPEQERRVEGARALGIDVGALLVGVISSLPALPETHDLDRPRTGAELLAYWDRNGLRGVFADDPRDSLDIADDVRRRAEDRGNRL